MFSDDDDENDEDEDGAEDEDDEENEDGGEEDPITRADNELQHVLEQIMDLSSYALHLRRTLHFLRNKADH